MVNNIANMFDLQSVSLAAATILALSIGYFIIRRHLLFIKFKVGSNVPFIGDESILSGNFETITPQGTSSAKKLEELFKTVQGDFMGVFIGDKPVVFTRDLDLLYKIWVTDSNKHINRINMGSVVDVFYHSLMMAKDNDWRRVRKAIGSTLTPSKLKLSNLEQIIDSCLDRMIANLKERSAKENTSKVIVDSAKLFKEFTMDISLDYSLDQSDKIDYSLEHNEIVEFAEALGKDASKPILKITEYVSILAPLVRYMLKPFNLSKFLTHVEATVRDMIGEAQQKKSKVDESKPKIINSLLDLHSQKRITTDELVANSFIILLSSWDTTGQTLVALMWQLAKNPEVQEKLRNDLIKHGTESQYLDWTLKETLRLNPASNTSRNITEDIEWKSVKIMKGMNVIMNPYSIHRDKTIWGPDVMEFRPERFEKSDQFHPAQFTPFGLGPRNCIGYYMAQSILKNAATKFITSYRISTTNTTPGVLELSDSTEVPPFLFCLKGKVPLEFAQLND